MLGELYANLGMVEESKEEFEKVIDFCDENFILQKQRHIAMTYIDAFEGRLPMPSQPPKRPGDVPLVPKPVQNKAFIARQSRKNHK